MPKLKIEFDTTEQSLSVQVDGETVENVAGVSLYNWNYDMDSPKFVFEVMACEDVNGVKKHTRLTANEKDGTPSDKFKGLFNAPVLTKAAKDILELMSRGRKI
jgi:hypothetical protein